MTSVQPLCPACRRPLVWIGSLEIGLTAADFRRQHGYRCAVGCLGPEPDGTFELIECPQCGGHDTSSTPRGDRVEEVECHTCGAITNLQTVSYAM